MEGDEPGPPATEARVRPLLDAVDRADHDEARRTLEALTSAEGPAAVIGPDMAERFITRAAAHRSGELAVVPPADTSGADYRGLFGALLQGSFDGVVLTSVETRWILEVSDSFCDLVGHDRTDLIGRSSEEVGFAEPNAVRRDAIDAANRGIAGLYETYLRHADGSTVWVEFSHQILGTEMVISIVRDVSARREMEAKLQSRTQDAEAARVEAERAQAEAERAWEEAQRANLAKSEFLSRMSHELRTPLNSVLGFAQLLKMDEGLSNTHRESVDQVYRAGRHLLNLINEVLDIARIETGDIALSSEAVHVGDLIEESLALIRPTADQHDVTLAGEPVSTLPRYAFADQHRLRQILLNLLSNAVKYNNPGGSVVVSTELVDPTLVRISVADTGPGIPPDQVDLVFVPFERLGAERTDIEGTGIGLSLSQRLAEAMGGTLGVDTTWGSGSTFWIELPIVEGPVERLERLAPTPAAPSEPLPDPAGPKHTVLQIDDNVANLKLVQRIFADRPDLDIIPALQGQLGIELAHEHRPDVILLDLHLPDLAGEQVLEHLRGDPATSAIPVVIVSADATPNQVQRLLSAGASGYITKPFDLNDLIETIDALLPADD